MTKIKKIIKDVIANPPWRGKQSHIYLVICFIFAILIVLVPTFLALAADVPTNVSVDRVSATSTAMTVSWTNSGMGASPSNRIVMNGKIVSASFSVAGDGTYYYGAKSLAPSTNYVFKIGAYDDNSGYSDWSFAAAGITKGGASQTVGPHASFADNSNMCLACHSVHKARTKYKALRNQYSEATAGYNYLANLGMCFNCHDGSGAVNNIAALYIAGADRNGHTTNTSSVVNRGWKRNLVGLPSGSKMPCMVCHDTHISTINNYKMLADGLYTYATSSVAQSAAYNGSYGEWTRGTTVPFQSATGNNIDSTQMERCTVCHHDGATGATNWENNNIMVVAGLEIRWPTGATSHSDGTRGNCYDCHNNAHDLSGGKPSGPVDNCTKSGCHVAVYNRMTAGVSSPLYRHLITVAASVSGTSSVSGSCTNMCHADHGTTVRPQSAYNLWTESPGSGSSLKTSANTDFIYPTSTGYSTRGGVCISCHSTTQIQRTASEAFAQGTNPTNANVTRNRPQAAISSSAYASSAHNFTMTMGTANSDGSWFNANCTKCHHENTSSYSSPNTRAWRGPHASDYNSLLVATSALSRSEQTCFGTGLGLSRTSCHGAGATPAYRNLESIVDTTAVGYATSAHGAFIKSTAWDERHVGLAQPGSATAASTEQVDRSNPNTLSYGRPTRHAECYDCHNPHVATTQAYTQNQLTYAKSRWPLTVASGVVTSPYAPSYVPSIGGRPSLHPIGSDAIGGANAGVWGVNITNWSGLPLSAVYTGAWGPTISNFTPVYPATKQWQICFKCHSSYAYGENAMSRPFTQSSGGTGRRQTPLPLEFNPNNYGYHPIISVGKNQPLLDISQYAINSPTSTGLNYNPNWPARRMTATFNPSPPHVILSVGMADTVAAHVRYGSFIAQTGGVPSDGDTADNYTWRMVTEVINSRSFNVKTPVGATSQTVAFVNSGLNATFVPPWGSQSLTACSDCHSPPSTAFAYGPHGSNASGWALRGLDTNIRYPNAGGVFNYGVTVTGDAKNFCLNCHRADVYNYWGNTSKPTYGNYSRMNGHPPDTNDQAANGDTFVAGEWSHSWCRRCHAGFSNGAVHGSNRSNFDATYLSARGKRLLNGATWRGLNRGRKGAPVQCSYTATDNDSGITACRGGTTGTSDTGLETYQYTWDPGPP